jgi:hypothetical protein
MAKLSSTARQQLPLARAVLGGPHRPGAPALHDHLRAGVGLRLQQHRVHVHRRRQRAARACKRLRPADLAAVGRHRGVVRHVLRLERRYPQAAPHQRAAQPRHHHRLADMAAGALQHHGGCLAHA